MACQPEGAEPLEARRGDLASGLPQLRGSTLLGPEPPNVWSLVTAALTN